MKSRIIKIAVIAAIILAAFFGYQRYTKTSAKKVETTTVKRGDLKQELTISGQIESSEHATLRFQTSGLLTWVGVKEGDYVQKYQGVAALDKRELEKTLQKYLETYRKKRNDFEDAKKTYDGPTISDSVKHILENSQADLTSSVLDVEIKDLALKFANLWTPIEGLVIRVASPYPGVNVTPTQSEVEIVNPKTVYFQATADQTEVTKITIGQEAVLKLDAFPNQEIPGHIERVGFTPDTSETGTVYDLKFVFAKDNSGYQYKLGMTGDLTFILLGKNDVVYLPSKFIKSDNGQKYVYLVKDDKKIKTPVKIGMETDDNTEVTEGLVEGQKVSE